MSFRKESFLFSAICREFQPENTMARLFLKHIIVLALVAAMSLGLDFGFALNKNEFSGSEQTASPKVRVQIQVIADSNNTLQADLEVPIGTPARDLMDRLFKMSYADFTHKFVNGIAGFTANARDKKFWSLEIDGKASEVGIAEIKLDKPMRIRWVMTEIK
jgi:hypothetical protein